jgi:hypothetical protein
MSRRERNSSQNYERGGRELTPKRFADRIPGGACANERALGGRPAGRPYKFAPFAFFAANFSCL